MLTPAAAVEDNTYSIHAVIILHIFTTSVNITVMYLAQYIYNEYSRTCENRGRPYNAPPSRTRRRCGIKCHKTMQELLQIYSCLRDHIYALAFSNCNARARTFLYTLPTSTGQPLYASSWRVSRTWRVSGTPSMLPEQLHGACTAMQLKDARAAAAVAGTCHAYILTRGWIRTVYFHCRSKSVSRRRHRRSLRWSTWKRRYYVQPKFRLWLLYAGHNDVRFGKYNGINPRPTQLFLAVPSHAFDHKSWWAGMWQPCQERFPVVPVHYVDPATVLFSFFTNSGLRRNFFLSHSIMQITLRRLLWWLTAWA